MLWPEYEFMIVVHDAYSCSAGIMLGLFQETPNFYKQSNKGVHHAQMPIKGNLVFTQKPIQHKAQYA